MIMMRYTISDFKQSAIGSFVAILVFFAIRGNNPFYFDPNKGLIITVLLLWIYYNGFRMRDKNLHFVVDIGVAFFVSALTAQTFGLIQTNKIFTYDVFGSLVIIGVWVAFAKGILFDRYNIVNPMSGFYVRGKGK